MGNQQNWVEMTDKELDEPVKNYADKMVAFKAFMQISVEVLNRGQSYKQLLAVDPKDKLDFTLRKKTHFWKTFMARGNYKCMLLVMYKGKDEENCMISEEDLQKSFIDNNVKHKSTLALAEKKNMKGSDDEDEDEYGDEGGEDEQEDPDEENEQAVEEEPKQPEGEEKAEQSEKPEQKEE
uniref:Uncharacterized protein n=1 Tax=Strombidium rassoulzadegani TaxID=1082188 RepID=A0A7S3CNL1_9SPIT|mmetsp:Transcript_18855/g.32221  ORF Transcript_18855/g.32221 Transcript_18855/m.32221 type:complete len:180 (+) Transcript_18855:476-1015(+)